MPPYNKDDSGLPPPPGILYKHIKQPPLDLTVTFVPLLRRVNGGNILDGDRPITKNGSFELALVFDLCLHKIPPSENSMDKGNGQHPHRALAA